MQNFIRILGARTHNLKNIHVEIPRNRLVVITGPSGSGKSSLAFDTIYAEGQRRYAESLSAYARQFLSVMEKPDVDAIEGLSPAIAIQQKASSHNPRSTVGTVTEIYDYLRLLYARVGTAYCPHHDLPLEARTLAEMTDAILEMPEGTRISVLAPVIRDRKGEYHALLRNLQRQGFIRVRVNGDIMEIDDVPALDKNKKHTIEVVVDRLGVRQDAALRIAESLETALHLSDGLVTIAPTEKSGPDKKHSKKIDDKSTDKAAANTKEMIFSARFSCPSCDYTIPEMEPRMFSFNNPQGACPECQGLGNRPYFDPQRLVRAELSLAEGAIRGWGPQNPYYYRIIESVADHYGISKTKTYAQLTKKQKDLLMHGSGRESLTIRHESRFGERTRRRPFEGVVGNLTRRYRETDSPIIHEELKKFMSISRCPACGGSRLGEAARSVRLKGVKNSSLPEISELSIEKCLAFFESLNLKGKRKEVADKILREVRSRLSFLANVGLGYLNLHRNAETLSGGEAQRIRLASQIGSGLTGVLYVLDEPSIGLHQRDNRRLLDTLKNLRDLGNCVLVVEHDLETIEEAEHIIDIGPGAGIHGGRVVAEGTASELRKAKNSLTGDYLAGRRAIEVPAKRITYDKKKVVNLCGARGNNLKKVNLEIPAGLFTCITGVSGSGKSTLINQTLYPLLAQKLNKAFSEEPGPHDSVAGLQHLDKVININQSPIGRTPRSNPVTYTGIFSHIREIFAATEESRVRGYAPGRFSFNVRGGRCEACEGDGLIKVEMHFLSDMYVACDQCGGKRYNRETLEVKYKNKSIYDVLEMTVEEALEFFSAIPQIAKRLQVLMDVGLSYIKLGHSAPLLSGGEAQRIKLSKELSRVATGKTLYILDEPTTGLHFHDIRQLLAVLHRLRNMGNTIVVIEHNLDVIKTADWVVDMGPEGGQGGGKIIAVGTPEDLAQIKESQTGMFLQKCLQQKNAS